MTHAKAQRWQWYSEINPLGSTGDDARTADIIRAMIGMVSTKSQPLQHLVGLDAKLERIEENVKVASGDIADEWAAYIQEHAGSNDD